jgi:hypothetical protein
MLALVGWLVLAEAAHGQCLGDFNANGAVEINEIITTVNNSLNGCGGARPTPTVPAGQRCPVVFTQNVTGGGLGLCAFMGPYNAAACPGFEIEIAWAGNGQEVVLVLDSDPVAAFAAEVVSATRVDILGWSTDGFETIEEVAGSARTEDNGARLLIEPMTPPFTIDGCEFRRYIGAFTEHRTTPRRLIDAADALTLLERARAWRGQRPARPLPDLQGSNQAP